MKNKTFPLVSIGVAAYNVEQYIDRCIKSLLTQTFPNIEIIIVNDGSTDQTGNICDRYAAQYNNIKVIHTTNKGVSSARNIFIDESQGEYLFFVDPDDWIDQKTIEKLYRFTTENNCDITMYGKYICYPDKQPIEFISIKKNGLIDKDLFMKGLLANHIGSQIWQNFYRKELWDGIRFTLGRVYGEDIAIAHLIFHKAQRIGNITEPLYYYTINSSSCTNSYRAFKWMSLYLSFKERFEFAHIHYPQYENPVKAEALNIARLTNDNYILRKEEIDKPYMGDLRKFLRSNNLFVIQTPYIKWYNKILILFYNTMPLLYNYSIKYIHKIYYHFHPNTFR